jgi:hypothetical protein
MHSLDSTTWIPDRSWIPDSRKLAKEKDSRFLWCFDSIDSTVWILNCKAIKSRILDSWITLHGATWISSTTNISRWKDIIIHHLEWSTTMFINYNSLPKSCTNHYEHKITLQHHHQLAWQALVSILATSWPLSVFGSEAYLCAWPCVSQVSSFTVGGVTQFHNKKYSRVCNA